MGPYAICCEKALNFHIFCISALEISFCQIYEKCCKKSQNCEILKKCLPPGLVHGVISKLIFAPLIWHLAVYFGLPKLILTSYM